VTPTPGGEYYPDGSSKFLKDFKVAEAEKIIYDSLTRNFTINLPQNFSADAISINLSLYTGVRLLDSAAAPISETIIKFAYKGSEPLRFGLQETKGSKVFYTVYVNVAGQPNIQLVNNEIPINSGPISLPVKIISGLGTTPSIPGLSNPTVKLLDRKTGYSLDGSYYNNLIYAYIPDASKLIASAALALEINFGNGKKAVFENLKFKRGLPKANLSGYENILIPKSDSMLVYGGYYSPGEKYTVRFSSDFVTLPISKEMKYLDSMRISNILPKDIPDGSYLVTFYEAENIIGKTSLYFSANKTHSIETIWKGAPELALSRNTEKISLKKGDIFYAKPWPPVYGTSSGSASTFNVKDLPALRMKSAATTMDLKPELTLVTWAVAGLTFSIGKYTVPENLAAGSYDATLVFPDNQESKPYWSKIEVR
jgi:hypothetical protein